MTDIETGLVDLSGRGLQEVMALSDPQVVKSQEMLLAHLSVGAIGTEGGPGDGGSTYFVAQPRPQHGLKQGPFRSVSAFRTPPAAAVPAGTSARHRLPRVDLDTLAAGRITARTAARIGSVERTRRMLMLREIAAAERATGPSGPLLPIADACDVIARAERLAPEAVGRVLSHPPVGLWAVRVLGRLGQDAASADGEPPLWQEVGYVHALAAAAALRAGLPVFLRIPTWRGRAALPTLGHAVLLDGEDGHGTADLESGGKGTASLSRGSLRLELPGDLSHSASGWHPVHTLHRAAGATTPDLALTLEDGDPYRDFRSCCPTSAPLTEKEVDRWRQLMNGARELLDARHGHSARLVSLALTAVVPLAELPRFRTSSASYAESYGSALVSLPHDAADLAVTLVHESRHSVLNGLSHQVGLFDEDAKNADVLLYAPWRTDPRPPQGLLHGAYAFSGVAEFWRAERHALTGTSAALAHFEYAVWRDAVSDVLESLRTRGGLSVWGHRFVGEMARQAAGWADDPVPDGALAGAQSELADLRATWRSRHLAPDRAATRRLAALWINGDTAVGQCLPVSELRPAPVRGQAPELRCELRRLLLSDGGLAGPGTQDRLTDLDRPSRLLDADLKLLGADIDGALRGYRAFLAEAPDDPAAWVGLGMALAASGDEAAASSLLEWPASVIAIAREARALGVPCLDPMELACWAGQLSVPSTRC
ncbi:HEXXH motif domain-containing protein [Streptomyces sp. NBC_01304]|uniref:HEXXH motif domain-containing protein n=1 Tax=Streptomyces sp. NBC_01304 TaxID=2903818 RepID=UPI002E10CE7E|nr:HEXXH motif domain-containing protein [Streptomyces sp. NBC_01304]